MEPVSGCNVMGPGSSKEEDQPLSIKMLTWRDEKPSQEAATVCWGDRGVDHGGWDVPEPIQIFKWF